MEYYGAFLLLALASMCAGQEVEVQILGSTRLMEKRGATMELTCRLNQGLPVILTHTIQWVHMSLADHNEPKETILTTQQTLTDKASPNDYAIEVDYDNTRCHFKLIVKKVRAQDDGIFICRVIKNQGGNKIEKEAHVIVPNDVERIAMQFDGENSIRGEVGVGLQKEEGRYGVSCKAGGFNPDASIRIFLGDEEQMTGGTEMDLDLDASKSAGARRYTAMATAADVHLKAEHSGRRLRCEAQAGFDGATSLVASVPLTIIVLEPVVTCDKNASGRPGEYFVKIRCRVQHDNIEIDRYSWEIDSTGEVIDPDKSNENYHEAAVQDLGNGETLVILDLYEVHEYHFDTVYFLDIFTKSGQKFRTEAELIRLPDASSSSRTSAVFLLCLLSAMLSLLSCH